jgi:hypothetical protein
VITWIILFILFLIIGVKLVVSQGISSNEAMPSKYLLPLILYSFFLPVIKIQSLMLFSVVCSFFCLVVRIFSLDSFKRWGDFIFMLSSSCLLLLSSVFSAVDSSLEEKISPFNISINGGFNGEHACIPRVPVIYPDNIQQSQNFTFSSLFDECSNHNVLSYIHIIAIACFLISFILSIKYLIELKRRNNNESAV